MGIGEQHGMAAVGALALIQRVVRALVEIVGAVGHLGIDGKADRARDLTVAFRQHEGIAQSAADPLASSSSSPSSWTIGNVEGELVAAQAGRGAYSSISAPRRRPDLDPQLVSRSCARRDH